MPLVASPIVTAILSTITVSLDRVTDPTPYYGISDGLIGIFLIVIFIWYLIRKQRINRQLQNVHNVNMARTLHGQTNLVYSVSPQVVVLTNPVPSTYPQQPPVHRAATSL